MSEQVYPNITVVNDSDEVIGYKQLFEAIKEGGCRRIVGIFVINEKNEILLQRRSAQVLSPNLIDFSAAGHVNEGATYLEAAKAELWEELKIKDVEFTLLLPPFKTPDFFNGMYRVIVGSTINIEPSPEEVAEVFWVSIVELERRIKETPEEFSYSFINVWPFVRDKILP